MEIEPTSMKPRFGRCWVAFTLLAAILFLWLCPQKLSSAETVTDSPHAGNLYRLQGEYRGILDEWGGNWGAQVIATGKQTVRVHLLKGGLPGDGFLGNVPDKSIELHLNEDENEFTSDGDSFVLDLKPGVLEVKGKAKNERIGILTKIVRESSTLGLSPPERAVILFGPRDNDFEGARVLDLGLGVGGTSRALMGDHQLHMEFCVPLQPNDVGQSRGNSGAYIQGRYEIQILDSFGLPSASNECGAIYQLVKPRFNMCYPPLSWQTYDVDFVQAKFDTSGNKTKNAKISVRHNGILIHDSQQLEEHTPGKMEESSVPGPLYLQDHGSLVIFRNVWFVPMTPSP
jgi:hypothetical protein